MIQLRTFPYPLTVLLSVFFLSGCAQHPSIDYDKTTDFTALKSYELTAEPASTTNDPRLNSRLIQQRIVKAVALKLTAKGFKNQKEKPDFVVKYHIDLKQEIESDRSGFSFGVGSSIGAHSVGGIALSPSADVSSYDLMVLTIDILSPSGELIWRGSKDRRLPRSSTPESNDKLVNELVAVILSSFPPTP